MKLSELLSGMEGVLEPPSTDVEVADVTMDSRQVGPGSLFVAVSGGTVDGHRFIADAIRRGAVGAVGELPYPELRPEQRPQVYVCVREGRAALAHLVAAQQGFPARRLTMIGVTGTDGKTTTSNLIFHILRAAGLKTGMISTVNAVIGDQVLDTGFHVTTPDAPSVQRYLARMAAAGLTHVVLEATSHGLAQRRVAACEFDMGVVTNITHEHLDYHGTFAAYLQAKGLLFSGLSETHPKPFNPKRGAVLNREDRSFEYLASITQLPYLSYGLAPACDVRAEEIQISPAGLRFVASGRDLDGERFRFPIDSRLVGEFNIYNCLAALTLARGLMRLDPEAVRRGVAELQAVPGRMESIQLGQAFDAIVDFAHTPNALRRSLETARQLTQGRVIAVFGSAGLRDRAKRGQMADVSTRLADFSVFTAEDPRTESLDAILDEMAQGARSAGGVEGRTFWRIADRREALRFAVGLARPGDLVIACGKGHEQSMCFGEVEYAWDDRTALRAALGELLGVKGPEMPFLPDPV